jgi:hypothetical protein
MPDAADRDAAEPLGRREFLKLAGAATLAGALPAAASAFAQATPPAAAPAPAAPDSSAAKAPEGPSEDAKALAAILRRRFPDRLSEEQWAAVTRDLDNRLAGGRRLATLKLANGDEPDFAFRP